MSGPIVVMVVGLILLACAAGLWLLERRQPGKLRELVRRLIGR